MAPATGAVVLQQISQQLNARLRIPRSMAEIFNVDLAVADFRVRRRRVPPSHLSEPISAQFK
jgi:hypothetical protein